MNQNEQDVGKFRFYADWPDELLPVVVELAKTEGWLVPAWCHEVVVTWHPDLDSAANARIEYSYRRLFLKIGATFFSTLPKERTTIFRHELLHASTLVPLGLAQDIINKALAGDENAAFREHCIEDIEERHESCVVDLLNCIEKQLLIVAQQKRV